jgi:5-(carboxyamino)imidazole ribonucleotide mutase
MAKAIIIMGSKADLNWAGKIREALERFGIEGVLRVASAHKTPDRCLEIINEYSHMEDLVFITVAGRSNALSGFVDAQTDRPVLACPPYSDTFGGVDIFSTLRMPSGVAPLVVIEPEGAALAAAKILALKDPEVRRKVQEYQQRMRQKVVESDREVSGG